MGRWVVLGRCGWVLYSGGGWVISGRGRGGWYILVGYG